MREKQDFAWIFLTNISIYLSKNQDGGGRHLETPQKS